MKKQLIKDCYLEMGYGSADVEDIMGGIDENVISEIEWSLEGDITEIDRDELKSYLEELNPKDIDF